MTGDSNYATQIYKIFTLKSFLKRFFTFRLKYSPKFTNDES